MELAAATARFAYLASALEGSGGFAPSVLYRTEDGTQKPYAIEGDCHITAYPRESRSKYAARVACAVYENHLLQACERFAAYLERKSPARTGSDSPLVAAFMNDCDDGGTALDVLMHSLVIAAKARGSMLVLLQMPSVPAGASMAQAAGGLRVVPYLQAVNPETVAECELDDRGRIASIGIHSQAEVDGKKVPVIRRWDESTWSVWIDRRCIEQGTHPFGQCPVLAITENGAPFPQVGKFAQIADLSRRLYNARSELDEILRGQTFSLLTLQIPPEVPNPADFAQAASATIGTHSLLVHQGATPAFIAPDSGPAQVYLERIKELQTAISSIGMEAASLPGQGAESGLSRKLRFEALNADLASFAQLMQDLEARIWLLWARAMGMQTPVQVQWATDYNLIDSAAELDILTLMIGTGFPDAILQEKRRTIVQSEFDRVEPDVMARLLASIDEQAQEGPAIP